MTELRTRHVDMPPTTKYPSGYKLPLRDRVLVIIDGRIAQLGTTAELRECEGWYRDWALQRTNLGERTAGP